MARTLDLLSNTSSTGSWLAWDGGRGTLTVEGTIAGATLSLQVQGPNGGSIDVGSDTTFTALPGIANFDLAPCRLRMAVSGGSPSALFARAAKIGEV